MDSDCEIFSDLDSGEESNENTEFATEIDPVSVDEESEVDDYPFEILSTNQIAQHMADCIKEVNAVVGLPPTVTRILLNHFKWDKEKMMERFYDGNQEKLFEEAHVVNPVKSSRASQSSRQRRSTNQSSEDCEICFVSYPAPLMAGLDCGHRFCTTCWDDYLTTKIMEDGVGQTIACAAHNCKILVDDESVMRLIKSSKVKLKYQHLITNSFVDCNRLLRWCPSPNCNNAVKVQFLESRSVTCRCGHTFCFLCGQNRHEPVKCELLKKWIKKCNEDLASCNWIAKNTKDCPQCDFTIEKNGGCNHITCGNRTCRHEFCWICLGKWDIHRTIGTSCNRYSASNESKEQSRTSLNRYLFYCNRYMNHMQSLKFEHKLYASVQKKMEEMQQFNMTWIECQFLKKAVDILCLCRQTLMYTYIFPYYLEKNNQIAIFENNQQDLENATESLSEYLERDITSENLIDIKQKVQDKYRYCSSRRNALLKHVHEGYDEDWWQYL
ncbi:E3 ubiquitin-protein ligase arih1-like [Belonocnema kinseyi]|uniref:E3 ubiquitin-protein ligase arih1-like n=1 Tax=Belonocnema kinseyi TaxID=2817044 RepID=UPI00143D708A|nr:E3 ubiquitin-protein ligase arih1-like [Belonocnema kinseyi]